MNRVHLHLHRVTEVPMPARKPSSTFTTDHGRGCTCHGTHDSDDGEGRWVTINGAAVHISSKGHIDKGPKELVGKHEHEAHHEHHKSQGKLHSSSAEGKGAQHADTPLHRKAASEHLSAAHQFKNAHEYGKEGNIVAAKNTLKRAEQHAAKAKEHTDELAKRNPEGAKPDAKKAAPFKKPDAHHALHSDAEDDVKGSEQHHAEHKRLVQQYDKAGADWERHAINNKISENATNAVKAKAENLHKRALSTSAVAHESDEPEDHQRAKEAIDAAKAAHERAGGNPDKVKELDKQRKVHHAKTLKEKARQQREAGKAAAKQEKDDAKAPPAAATKKAAPVDHAAAMEHHEKQAEDAKRRGDHEAARAHANAYRAHMDAAKTSEDHKQRAEVAQRASEKAAATAKKPAAAPPANNKPAVWRSNRTSSHGSGGGTAGSHLAKIAKRAAEEAADQDPKHKK